MSVARYSVIVAFVVTLAVIAGGVFMRLSAQLTLSAPTISNITQTSVTISWTTDVPATTQMSYGTTYNYTDKTSLIDTLTTEHTQTLSGLAPGTIYHYLVESGNGTSFGAVGDNTFTTLAAADTPPTITLNVYATSPATWRPGGRGYYTWSITDDKSLQSVVITTSQMMYSGTSNDVTYQCQGKTFCEEKVYIIVPSNPGAQFVTVTVTDSANQTSTKTVTFDASACTTDADCGGGAIQWAGASFCGAEGGAGLETDIMQYGVGATCKAGGICDTSSLPRVKQKCATGQVCTFGSNGVNLCIAQPSPCTVGAQITSICTCGNATLNYPYDWRVSMPTYCCSSNGVSVYNSGPCSALSSSVSSASSSPKSASASTLSMSSVSTSRGAGGTLAPPSWSSTAPVHASPSIDVPSVPFVPSPAAPSLSVPQSVGEKILPHSVSVGQEKRVNTPGSKKEAKILKGKIVQAKKKIASIEKNILSFERKIDVKLFLLDRMKSEAAQKRVHAQIDRWEEKIASLEVQKEKKEAALEDLQVSLEQWKAAE